MGHPIPPASSGQLSAEVSIGCGGSLGISPALCPLIGHRIHQVPFIIILLSSHFWPMPSMSRGMINCAGCYTL